VLSDHDDPKFRGKTPAFLNINIQQQEQRRINIDQLPTRPASRMGSGGGQ
jgi:hypothetical protein